MMHASYDDIAGWYDSYLNENSVYSEVILPSLLELVGDVQDCTICDLACGQGWFARELAKRGARVTGIDISDRLLELARQYELQQPRGITYQRDDARSALSLPEDTFEGIVCVLSLMDIPDIQAVFQTARRILQPGGWLVFAITHPCFELPDARWITDEHGQVARAVTGYFKEGNWKSERGGVRSRVGAHHRMLSTYLNALVSANFTLERVLEPTATGERADKVPGNREVPSFLFIRARLL
ncbi:class I SAM-dependent methyltransferase [Dictyobacter aurantiacus]|uniref:Methyltransferase n=1 Tax=Dictyobacter aurantiacus TaxID=1936993 RepID=A0A401ZGT7_9CHLR|nr:class I SAM-dependent methyltransferase [Dictyobacter aurantiacus]GCE06100.1 methyltransferase [Dictyobacter aurantiacus]